MVDFFGTMELSMVFELSRVRIKATCLVRIQLTESHWLLVGDALVNFYGS